MTGEVKDEVERLLRAGDRPGAVQYLQATFNVSVEEASILIEALEREEGIAPANDQSSVVTAGTRLDGPLKSRVAALLTVGRKMEAIKLVRKELHIGLREALSMVEEVAREINPNYVSVDATGCLRMVAKGLGVFLMTVSLMFLAAGGVFYFLQYQSISNSDKVSGVVTEMKLLDTGESAPVVEYEWKGSKRSYESTYYASPPDYQVGQKLDLYVNRDDPEDITLDTFADRYAIIVGLSVPGALLLVVSIVFLYFGRRKF